MEEKGRDLIGAQQADPEGKAGDLMMYLVPRLEGLMDILEGLGMDSQIILDDGVIPYVAAERPGSSATFFTYEPIDVMGDGKFILEMARTVRTGDDDTETTVLDIEAFNLGSTFGFAVQDPATGDVVLRVQAPELGGISSEWYAYVTGLFDEACDELARALADGTEEM